MPTRGRDYTKSIHLREIAFLQGEFARCVEPLPLLEGLAVLCVFASGVEPAFCLFVAEPPKL